MMMRSYIATCTTLLFLTITGCATTTPGTSPEDTVKAPPPPVFDTKNPTTFEDYKRWRALNNPQGQAYADYKDWEAGYQQWLRQQQPEL